MGGAQQDLDTMGLHDHVLARPDQVRAALGAVGDVAGLPDREGIASVVVVGSGEAALAGDLIAAVAGPFMAVPLVVHRGYELPSFVGPDTLVVALSASGATAETLAPTEAAFEAGAALVAVTRPDGLLAELSDAWQTPVIGVDPDTSPRTELVPLSIPPLLLLEDLGLFPGAREWVVRAHAQLVRRREEITRGTDPAAEIARVIGRTIPIVYAAGPLGQVAARRWKHQVNLSAKVPSFSSSLPDLCHNEIAGWGQHGDVTRQVFTRVDLRHDHEHPDDGARFEQVAEMTLEVVADVARVEAQGEGALAQLLDLTYLGDLCAIEMALAEGVDPGPIPAIEALRLPYS